MMNLVQLTPGAGAMYCGNCLRDNATVAALRRMGHQVLMVPLYLPLTLDEEDHSAHTPIFFSGVNVYLDQKAPIYRRAPDWLRRRLSSRALLRWTGKRAAKTRAAEVGDLTLSMLRGEAGNQARDLEELIGWLQTQPRADAFCLSNALLLGMAHRLKTVFRKPLICMLSGEDTFLDGMPEPTRSHVWDLLSERAQAVDLFLAPSRYFADLMRRRLRMPPEQFRVLPLGLNLAGFPRPGEVGVKPSAPTLGYFTRMCPEKGLDTLVQAFIELKRRRRVEGLRLKVGGGCGPADEAFVAQQRDPLAKAGHLADVEFHPNVDRAAKIEFLRSLTVFSVPALYGEAYGLYLLEAMAAGAPVVQPRHAGFPEVIESTGGGILCDPGKPVALADAIETLLLDEPRRARLARTGQEAVHERFSADQTAAQLVDAITRVTPRVK